MAEAMSDWAKKHYSCVLRRRRGGGRVENSPGLPGLRIFKYGDCSRGHYYTTQLFKQTGQCYPRTSEFRLVIKNDNRANIFCCVTHPERQMYMNNTSEPNPD